MGFGCEVLLCEFGVGRDVAVGVNEHHVAYEGAGEVWEAGMVDVGCFYPEAGGEEGRC